MKGNYIFLAEGYEPLEALGPMDVLCRARVKVNFVSTVPAGAAVGSSALCQTIPSTQGYALPVQMSWEEFLETEKGGASRSDGGCGCMIFPGGLPGAATLGENPVLMDMLREHYANGGLVAAICAAPAKVLARNIDVRGKRMTVYSGFEQELIGAGAISTEENVVIDGNLITAKGPGLAIDFGLAILSKLVSDQRVTETVKHAMML